MEIQKTVDVIVPTYKPDIAFRRLVTRLERQTYPINCLRIMNTGEKYWSRDFESKKLYTIVEHVTPEEFDHGGTRDHAADASMADYILFMTQDALPKYDDLIERLVEAMESGEKIKAAYARQMPAANCKPAERYTRRFNYPPESRTKGRKDLPELGIKTFFCSNVCAMYDRETYEELGGFTLHTIFNEDMIFAGTLVQAGYEIAYAAEAKVIHSHNYSALQQFHRNFDLGVSQKDHPEIFAGISSEGEGKQLVKSTALWLSKRGTPWLIIPLIWNSGWKYLGYLLGKRYRKLPRWFIMACTMNKHYWTEEDFLRKDEDDQDEVFELLNDFGDAVVETGDETEENPEEIAEESTEEAAEDSTEEAAEDSTGQAGEVIAKESAVAETGSIRSQRNAGSNRRSGNRTGSGRSGRTGYGERTGRGGRAGYNGRSRSGGRSGNTGRTAHTGRNAHTGRSGNTGRTAHNGRSGNTGRTAHTGRTGRTGKNGVRR